MLKLLLITNLLYATDKIDRIQSFRFDRSQVKQIYLAPGLGTKIMFPCALAEAFAGRNDDLKTQISPNDKKVLYLNLKLNNSYPTNLIVSCETEKTPYVFDVIPSKTRHQDIIEIKSGFGSPVNRSQAQLPIKPPSTTKVVLIQPTLMKENE